MTFSIKCLSFSQKMKSIYISTGVCPAISLAPGTIITSGDGTNENPFTVEKDG